VPFVVSPPGVPFTDQVTDWFVVPVTVAKNCWESPVRTVIVTGVTLTVICCGGGPELPQPQTYHTTKASGNENQRLGMSHPFLPHPGTKTDNPARSAMPSREAIPPDYTTRDVKLVALIALLSGRSCARKSSSIILIL